MSYPIIGNCGFNMLQYSVATLPKDIVRDLRQDREASVVVLLPTTSVKKVLQEVSSHKLCSKFSPTPKYTCLVFSTTEENDYDEDYSY